MTERHDRSPRRSHSGLSSGASSGPTPPPFSTGPGSSACDEGTATGSYSWAPTALLNTQPTTAIKITPAPIGVNAAALTPRHTPNKYSLSVHMPGTSPKAAGPSAEYSVSGPAKAGGSQSFHQDSGAHNLDLEEEDRDAAGPFGLMDPGLLIKPAALPPGPRTSNGTPNLVPQPATTAAPVLPSSAASHQVISAYSRDAIPYSAAAPLSPTKKMSKNSLSHNAKAASTTDDGQASPEAEPDFYAHTDSKHSQRDSRSGRGASKWACPASCGGYNFVKVFVILTACQVLIVSVCIWAVGYFGLVAATQQLSDQVRQAVLETVLVDINNQLAQPLRASTNLQYMTRTRYPDIETRVNLTTRSGYLADLFEVGLRFPSLSRIGWLTASGNYITIQRSPGSTGFTSNQKQYVGIANPVTGMLNTYQPSPIPSRNLVPNVQPLQLNAEIYPDDTAAFINSYLGSPIYSASFNVTSLGFYQSILNSVNASVVRQLNPTQVKLNAGWSAPFTSTDRFTAEGNLSYLSIESHSPSVNAITGNFTWAAFALFRLSELETSLTQLPFGDHGIVHIVRAGGDIVASSMPSVQAAMAESQEPYPMSTSTDELMQKVRRRLIAFGMIKEISGTGSVPYTNTTYSVSLTANGVGWRLDAQMIDRTISGLPYVVALLTRDSDFDGNVQTTIRNSILAAVAICIAAMLMTFGITRCLTRPLLTVVDYMDRAVKVISMDRGQQQREALGELCENWSGESGMIMPPLLNSGANHTAIATRVDPFIDTPLYASFCWLCNDAGDSCCCFRVGRSLREVQMMHSAFGSMLYTLASYDELEAINQAKRQFIRYIFHEVRVPFNAIVMGIEQMQLELAPHQLNFSNTIETLDILREQSAVVSRILNDVLSMQKIEDGALVLEYDTFSLERMIRGALYAFRTPCLEKRLKVRVNLQSLDDLVNEALPGLRLGKLRVRAAGGAVGTSGAVGALRASNSVEALGNNQATRANFNTHSNTAGSSEISGAQTSEMYHAQVRGDPYRLRQCLANFVSNAIKFTPIGGMIRVSLDVSRFEANPLASIASDQLLVAMGLDPKHKSASRGSRAYHSWHQPPGSAPMDTAKKDYKASPAIVPELLGTVMVKVSVKDSGSGIPIEHQAGLFEAYRQVQAGKLQRGNGTGLGLNISKSIVELHGGQIQFSSVAGEGAEFQFSLPLDVMLVRTGSKGDSSSYEQPSQTPNRSDKSRNSGQKLEPIAGSPDMPARELGLPIPNGSSVPSTPEAPPQQKDRTLPLPQPRKSTMSQDRASPISNGAMAGQHTISFAGDRAVVFHEDVELTSFPPQPQSADIAASPPSESVAPSPLPPIHPPSHHSPSQGTLPSSGSNNGKDRIDVHVDPFKDSGTSSRSRSRGLRGANMGVSIPSSAANTSHSSAQNLTASVKTINGTSTSATAPTSAVGRAAASASASPNSLQGVRVLVVEDSHPNRKLLMSLLVHMGCKSSGVENGKECVDLFASCMTTAPSSKTQHVHHMSAHQLGSPITPPVDATSTSHYPFDVILMDGSMPVMNGVEATQILRQHGVTIPIIAVTGNALAEDVCAFETAGCNWVLTKPINRKKLQEVLTAHAPTRPITPQPQ